jgi:8-oxo-dGTP pyrophosphatase MutT (NUDIX family)
MVMLVTSRDTGRWVLPKGWVEPDVTASRQAAREAFEEAGILGTVARRPIGTYEYAKRLARGRALPCDVAVFPLAVESLARDWPEKAERQRRWFSLRTAAGLVDEPELGEVMRLLEAG